MNSHDALSAVLDATALVGIVVLLVGILRRRPLAWKWFVVTTAAVTVAWLLHRSHFSGAFLWGVLGANCLLVANWFLFVRRRTVPGSSRASFAFAAIAVAAAVPCLLAARSAQSAMEGYEPLYSVGDVAPAIAGVDVDGRRVSSSDARGKVLLVVFSGDWCGPCRGMYPQERALAERTKREPFALLGVESDSTDAARAAATRESIGWPVVVDDDCDGPIATAWDIQTWPTTVLVDASGVIRRIHLRGEELDRAIDELIAETKPGR
jgi:peroxiredoxin